MYGIKNYVNRGFLFANNQLRPSKKKLATLMIYSTDLCDSGCKHCLIWAKRPVVHMSLKAIKKIMTSKCITPNTMVGLEGGEFLLHPQALDIMQWFYENHPKFDLLSNCLKPSNVIEAVKKYPPHRLYLSLDGNKTTYKYMRGKDGYDSVLKVIEDLHKVVPISLMFTLSPYNGFEDMEHVAKVAKKYNIDMRVGIYNDIAFFDTVEKAHETEIGTIKDKKKITFREAKELTNKKQNSKQPTDIHVPPHDFHRSFSDFSVRIPQIIHQFKENYDYIILYDQWRRNKVKLKCFSILDSLVILPNGDVPICQNLDLMLGNIHKQSLDDIFNGKRTQNIHKEYVHNCNQCWINFHRKYDVILYRNFEKFFGRSITSKLFGYYQWEEDASVSYDQLLKKHLKREEPLKQ